MLAVAQSLNRAEAAVMRRSGRLPLEGGGGLGMRRARMVEVTRCARALSWCVTRGTNAQQQQAKSPGSVSQDRITINSLLGSSAGRRPLPLTCSCPALPESVLGLRISLLRLSIELINRLPFLIPSHGIHSVTLVVHPFVSPHGQPTSASLFFFLLI